MNDSAMLIIAIIGFLLTWTASVAALAMWLTGKFRDLEKVFYREMDKHRREDDIQFNNHSVKIMRLEIKTFGFTENEPSLTPQESTR